MFSREHLMSTAMPFSHCDSNSSASPSTFSDTSFCLSTACTDSALTDSNHFSAKPNRPSCEPYRSPRNLQEFDKSIYSFTWSLSYSQHLEVDAAIESYSMTDSQQLHRRVNKLWRRHLADNEFLQRHIPDDGEPAELHWRKSNRVGRRDLV